LMMMASIRATSNRARNLNMFITGDML